MGSGPGLGRLLGSAEHPGEADHGDGETDHARDLRDAEVAEPEAVEAERFDGESADGVEADVAEEQRAGMPPEPRAEQQDEDQEDTEVPERLVEEGGVEVLVLLEAERPLRRRDVELPWQIRGAAEGLLVEEVTPTANGLTDRDAGRHHVQAFQNREPPSAGEPYAHDGA